MKEEGLKESFSAYSGDVSVQVCLFNLNSECNLCIYAE
nr:hypothetical protein Iba_chr03aCG9940 [Ipomoea batatas]